jgi:hypothetical protein
MQYFVLRQGGTESPNFSILEAEERPGITRALAVEQSYSKPKKSSTVALGGPLLLEHWKV